MRSYVLALAVLLPIAASAQGPTVYINGDQGVSANSSAFALGGVAVGGASVAKHDKTMEMAQVLLDSCPEISVTVDGTGAHFDYVLLLNQAAGYGGSVGTRSMVLRSDKTVIFASKQGRVSRVMKDGCKAIMADWKDRRAHTARTVDPQGNWTAAKP